jgi:RHH-type proline utilization regulon transcriptional repressor/proline dehydrogenase/delta 1-pyrroline-5-carboxylate dehydrogenase
MNAPETPRAIGVRLFQHMTKAGPALISKDYWENQLMELSMANEQFKVRMFHFVDVFPMLHSAKDVARHFHEYFPTLEGVPTVFKAGMAMAKVGLAPDFIINTAAGIGIKQMAKKFITAETAKDALGVVEKLRARNLGFTLDVLGEATVNEVEADRYVETYQALIPALAARAAAWKPNPRVDGDGAWRTPPINVSVKLTSLYSQMTPLAPDHCVAKLKDRLRLILRSARDNNVALNVDQEQYMYKDIILRVFMELLDEAEFADYPFAGIVVQVYLREAARDVQTLLTWARPRKHPVHIRLVKGAYWDYETVIAAQKHLPPPVFTRKWQSDANYEQISAVLLDNYTVLRPAFASHNIRSIATAIAMAEARKVPRDAYEFQVLFGMGDPIAAAVTAEGHRCRVYAPYGDMVPGMGYLVRRLLENTSNDSFLLQTMAKKRDEEALLQDPHGEPEELPAAPAGFFVNTPEVDWADARNRSAMQAALAAVRPQCGATYPLFINGVRVNGATQRASVNPARPAEVIGRVAQADLAQVEQAIAAARAAYPAWRDTPPATRAEVLFAAARIAERRRFELAAWMVLEAAKPWNEAMADVEETIDYFNYYAHEMLRLAAPRHCGNVPGEVGTYVYEAKGVGVIISPWNFPLAITAGMTVGAVVTGNTVVIKPSNFTPVIAFKLVEILQEAGVPNGVINYLPGAGATIGDALVRSPEVNFIAFTGSQEVGLRIGRMAAETPGPRQGPKRVIAEMGGKNAVIIDSDADLDEAIVGVIRAAFGYAGQKCSACSRVVVVQQVYEQFCRRLAAAVTALVVGPAEDPATLVNPVIDTSAQASIQEYIAIGKKEARLLVQHELGDLAQQGFYVAPTVFADVAPDARIAQEEIFGPVLAVIKAEDMRDALAIANNSAYALTGGLFSRSPETIARVTREFHVGNLYINRPNTGAIVERHPFGGFRMSGIGSKAGGPDYLLQFVNPRTVTENTLRRGFAPRATA